MVKDIKISDFDYPLPEDRIAKHPLAERDRCRLLVSRVRGEILHDSFASLPDYLESGSLLICNNTRVINARIRFVKPTGSKIEVFLLEPLDPQDYALMFQTRGRCRWSCMVGNLKRWKEASLEKEIEVDGRRFMLRATRGKALEGNAHEVDFEWDDDSVTFASVVEAAGYIPIPPYLRRDSEASDAEDYQTVYAETEGSVAAPTAGLHFTPAVFEALERKGIETMPVTLHVGAGTFQPVKSEEIGGHLMHTETFSVERRLVAALADALRTGRKVTAVGTTSVRTLESLPYLGLHLLDGRDDMHVDQWEAYATDADDADLRVRTIEALDALLAEIDRRGGDRLVASTSIMIAPGFRWRIVDAMVTNFHQPQSTLLLLVSSFLGADEAGKPRWRSLYDAALAENYRFLSYGDACYFEKG